MALRQKAMSEPGTIAPPRRSDNRSSRQRMALACAAASAVAAVLVALGPADARHHRYTWPSAAAVAADAPYFAPLQLARHQAQRITVRVACGALNAADRSPGQPVVIASTGRTPVLTGGLSLTLDGSRLSGLVGPSEFASVDWTAVASDDPTCQVDLVVEDARWQLTIDDRVESGTLAVPAVSGLLSDLAPVGRGKPVAITVTTQAAGSDPSTLQIGLTAVALLGFAISVGFLALRRPEERRLRRPRIAQVMRSLHWADGIVAIGLMSWWILGPALVDDGYVLNRSLDYGRTGEFASILDPFGAPLGFGYFHHLAILGLAQISTAMVWLRLSALLVTAIAWIACRYSLNVMVRDRWDRRPSSAALATLVFAFVLVWIAWLNTLRPEPAVAMLAVITLVGAQSFVRSPSIMPLIVAGTTAALALSIHPAGIVALAPLIALVPHVWRWLQQVGRTAWFDLATAVLAVSALGLLLLFVDTDLDSWQFGNSLLVDSAHNLTWRDELTRYDLLFSHPEFAFGTTARQASIVFPFLAVPLFLTRRKRGREPLLDLVGQSLILSVGLIAFTPSKWPWQFGALGLIAALAISVEIERLRADRPNRVGRQLLVIGSALAGSILVWSSISTWSQWVLVQHPFEKGGKGVIGFDLSRPLPWLMVVAASFILLAVIILRRTSKLRVRTAVATWLGSVSSWAIAASTALVVVVTIAAFMFDAARTAPAWSVGGQSIDELLGGPTCGIADDLLAANASRGVPLALAPESDEASGVGAVVREAPELASLGVVIVEPKDVENLGAAFDARELAAATGIVPSPWYLLPNLHEEEGVGVWTSGTFGIGQGRLFVQYGRADAGRVTDLGVFDVSATQSDATWLAHDLTAVEVPPRGADRLRVIGADPSPAADSGIAFTAPRSVKYLPLAHLLTRPNVATLVGPQARLYVPCVTDPSLRNGVAEPPRYLISDTFGPIFPFGPESYLWSLYPLRPMLLRAGTSPIPPLFTVTFVDRDGALGTLVPASRRLLEQ